MAFSLYDATVPTYLQIAGAVRAVVERAEQWATENGFAEADIIGARLASDMYDFSYQVKSVGVHSWGAIEGLRQGHFKPDTTEPPQSFSGLFERMDDIIAKLSSIEPAEIDGFLGKAVEFSIPRTEFRLPFVAENFLLSFSQPNFFFHATTAYDLLRNKGMDVGKRDFLGQMRLNQG